MKHCVLDRVLSKCNRQEREGGAAGDPGRVGMGVGPGQRWGGSVGGVGWVGAGLGGWVQGSAGPGSRGAGHPVAASDITSWIPAASVQWTAHKKGFLTEPSNRTQATKMETGGSERPGTDLANGPGYGVEHGLQKGDISGLDRA